MVELYTISDIPTAKALKALFLSLYNNKRYTVENFYSTRKVIHLVFNFGSHGQEDMDTFVNLAFGLGLNFSVI